MTESPDPRNQQDLLVELKDAQSRSQELVLRLRDEAASILNRMFPSTTGYCFNFYKFDDWVQMGGFGVDMESGYATTGPNGTPMDPESPASKLGHTLFREVFNLDQRIFFDALYGECFSFEFPPAPEGSSEFEKIANLTWPNTEANEDLLPAVKECLMPDSSWDDMGSRWIERVREVGVDQAGREYREEVLAIVGEEVFRKHGLMNSI